MVSSDEASTVFHVYRETILRSAFLFRTYLVCAMELATKKSFRKKLKAVRCPN